MPRNHSTPLMLPHMMLITNTTWAFKILISKTAAVHLGVIMGERERERKSQLNLSGYVVNPSTCCISYRMVSHNREKKKEVKVSIQSPKLIAYIP